jgi:hypothetical protein
VGVDESGLFGTNEWQWFRLIERAQAWSSRHFGRVLNAIGFQLLPKTSASRAFSARDRQDHFSGAVMRWKTIRQGIVINTDALVGGMGLPVTLKGWG